MRKTQAWHEVWSPLDTCTRTTHCPPVTRHSRGSAVDEVLGVITVIALLSRCSSPVKSGQLPPRSRGSLTQSLP
jgi:hypothetical protein